VSKKDSKKVEETCSCQDPGCCPAPSSEQPSGIKKWWKIGVFSLGVVLIIAATTYSLLTRHISTSNSSGTGSIPQITETGCALAANSLGISDLDWAKEVKTTFSNHNVVFVILPEEVQGSVTDTLRNRISDASAKIEAQGSLAGTFTLDPSNPEFSTTLKRLALAQLPAVIALSDTGNGAIVTGDITEGRLLQVYVTISQPVCAPGSGCCPK